jgi:hypothetical protein
MSTKLLVLIVIITGLASVSLSIGSSISVNLTPPVADKSQAATLDKGRRLLQPVRA